MHNFVHSEVGGNKGGGNGALPAVEIEGFAILQYFAYTYSAEKDGI